MNDGIIRNKEILINIEKSISDMCAETNRTRVKELLKSEDESIDGVNQSRIWDLKRKLINKNTVMPPSAKKDEDGNLVTDKTDLENLYVNMYKSRLTPNPTSEELKELGILKSELHSLNIKIAKGSITEDWTLKHLEAALKTCKNNHHYDSQSKLKSFLKLMFK